MLRFRVVPLPYFVPLAPLLLSLAHAPAVFADDRCEQWSGISLSLKRKAVQESFDAQTSAESNAHLDRCLLDSSTRMANEMDAACKAGGDLGQVWSEAGMAWIVTCTVVAERVEAGERTSAVLRKETREAVAACADEGVPIEKCRNPVKQRFVSGSRSGRGESECGRFLAMPRESRLAEVEDRIRERFSTTPDVARCMNAESRAILDDVASLCRRGVAAPEAWSQALGVSTDRCLDRDFGL